VVVSGLALGIDAIAHEAALAAKITTVAVPGSGLDWDILYPVANRKLGKRILAAGGALISEFENDFKARPENFPQRNRIMAGMSHAVLVIEAEQRSGTLITSRLATEYNRDVFTVPGSIFSSKTEGPHMLMRLGATPMRNSEDILVALGLVDPEAEIKNKKGRNGKRGAKSNRSNKKREYKNCSENEKKILSILEVPMNRHDLIRESGMDTSTTIITLSLLELKGLVHENMGEIRLK
jgi:DNA processing protein